MKNRRLIFVPALLLLIPGVTDLCGSDAPPPVIDQIKSTGSQTTLRFPMYPAAQAYTILSATNPGSPFALNTNCQLAPYITGYTVITNNTSNGPVVITVTNLAYEWRATNAPKPGEYYRVGITPLTSNAVLTAHVLNRLAYGQTPDELERVTAIGPQAFINEQLNMDGIPETMDNYTVLITNAVATDPTTNWTFISVTGTVASTTFYLFTTQPGEIHVDDIELRPYRYFQNITTNVVSGTNVYVTNRVFSYLSTNMLQNSDFESGYGPGRFWTNAGGHSASTTVTNGTAHAGSSCLRVVSITGASSTGSSYIRQGFANGYATTNSNGDPINFTYASTDQVILNYWYLPSTNSNKLRLQLGSGVNSTPGGIPPAPRWVYATATGTANANSRLYLYLNGAGECYVDDIKLVAGTVPGAGPNLLQNGGFESGLTAWVKSADFTNSTNSSTIAFSGSSSLRVIASNGGGGNNDSVQQNIAPALTSNQTYTVSYWYLPATPNRTVTVKLDGNALQSTPDSDAAGLFRRLSGFEQNGVSDYRAWFALHAVNSPRQLFEVLSQFWENHFVTQYGKTREYLNGFGYDGTMTDRHAADWEFREMLKWRNAMLNPQCTFQDLLRFSAESPAMIVYLDTVNSRGSGTLVANENYARELLELFCNGVDNGYDQNDIIRMSRAWTGWSVELVDVVNAGNPFAPASLTYVPGLNGSQTANKVGVWAFNFKSSNHGTNQGAIFAGKSVPARCGSPWTTKIYGTNVLIPGRYDLVIPPTATGTTNGIQDGYRVIAHLADLPFTQEYLSVKLCRLFVHDDFPNPTTTAGTPEYAFYDYTNPDISPEAELVHECMLAWENSNPKGQIRAVLNTIFNSELFRTHAAAAQKVKTPLEYVASSVRALRSLNANGTYTASTDGFSFNTRLVNMGGMALFDRAEPDGYPEAGPPWISSGTLVERIRYVQALCNSGTGDDAGNHVCDPVTLLKKKLASGSWNNTGAVADYFLGILYPGEGAGNLVLYRTAAVNYLNSDDAGNSNAGTQFASLGNTTTTYDTRVRGMVSMLMTFQRFQEQ